MTRKSWTILAILLAALAGVQHFGLERRPETRAENALRNLPQVSAGDMLPTYVASLFFGAFRAVAIDVLWIQLKRAEEERRWYERREILKMISYVQPRNPEVWSHLGWHSAYNVANGFTDGKKVWSWVRFGLTWLRQGIRMLPDNPHLKFELAFTLLHKPSWRDAKLDLALLKKIEEDAELQRDLLPDDAAFDGRPRSAFALARLWLERAKSDIARAGEEKRHKTQMGLYIYLSSLDGYIRKTIYLQAVRAWQQGDHARAVELVREAAAHVQRMLEEEYPEGGLSSIFKDWRAFYGELPAAIEAHARAVRSGAREDELAALKALQDLFVSRDHLLDEGFIWSRSEAGAVLNALKRRIVGEADEGECNDAWVMSWDLEEGRLAAANIAPAGLDVDWYGIRVEPPPAPTGESRPSRPPVPLKLRLSFTRPPTAGLDLKVTVYSPLRRPLRTEELKSRKAEIELPAEDYGVYGLKVEPLDPAAAAPPDTRYFFQYAVEE